MSKPADDIPDLILKPRQSTAKLPAAGPAGPASRPGGPPSSKAAPKAPASNPGDPGRTSGLQKKAPPSMKGKAAPVAEEENSLMGVSMGSGMGEDDPFADDDDGPPIDLDMTPAPASARMAQMAPQMAGQMAPLQGGAQQGAMVEAEAPAAPPPPREPTPAEVLAGYGETPKQFWLWPRYAVQVLRRQHELRGELASLRMKNSPEVPLYEQAMRAHDAKAFAQGLVMFAAAGMLLMLAFISPVIVRFIRLAMED